MFKSYRKLSLLALISVLSLILVSCGGGSGGGNNPVLSDADAVAEDRDDLAIIYAAGDSAASVTQKVTLSTAGSNGTTIAWTSGNSSVIAIDGTVIRPTYNDGEDATVAVTLTATISKNGESETKTFTLTVIKISASAMLSNITVSKGILQPAFNSSITTYLDAPVPFSDSATPAYNDTQSASITATAINSAASIKINSNSVTSGSAYAMNNLAVGANTVTIVVTAEDGVTTATYVVTVYRAIPIFKTGAGAISGYTLDSREDGSTQLGVSWPATRFTDNGNGTMTDNMTGLVWLKSLSTSTYTWADGITYCEGLTTGATDWRMPNVRELRSLIHYGQSASHSWLNGQGFSNVKIDYPYMSGTTSLSRTDYVWCIDMLYGIYSSNNQKISSFNMWPVRTESLYISETGQNVEYLSGDDGTYQKGVKSPSTRFHDNADGTITDNMTGLMWLKNANNAGTGDSWSNALAYVDGLNNGTNSGNCGRTDWRLPTVNELDTLINYGQSAVYTWLNSQGFINVQNYAYWSSTTFMPTTGSDAWIVGMSEGYASNGGSKGNGFLIWPVRGPVK